MDLTIHPGEKLAIVGLNGAGKITLVKLLCGFLDPTEGRVLLNGEDIRQYDRRDYYTMFIAVFQEFSPLQTTLAANVVQTEDHIDYDRVKDCVERAGFANVVDKLPKGLKSNSGKINEDGIELSGGQTQRLMLVRALYKDFPFIILDEPTAALDPIAEAEIYAQFNEISGDKTAIYISHRLSSCKFCDEIAVFHEGAVIQQGTHEKLVSNVGGKYYELWNAQAQYYIG